MVVEEIEEALEDNGEDNGENEPPQTFELGLGGRDVLRRGTRLAGVFWSFCGVRARGCVFPALRAHTVSKSGVTGSHGERLGSGGDGLAVLGGGGVGDVELVDSRCGERPVGVGMRGEGGLDGVIALALSGEQTKRRAFRHLSRLDGEGDRAVLVVVVV